jgi:hypothetical protein
MTLENKMEKDDHCQLNDNDPKLNNHLQPYFVGMGLFYFPQHCISYVASTEEMLGKYWLNKHMNV